MSDPTKRLTCDQHGESHACFLCGHLPSGVAAGFFTGDDAEGDPRPDAWCARCEEVVNAEGEWNERSEGFARITLCCTECYDDIRRRNAWAPKETEAAARFTCGSCGEVHAGLPTDFGSDAPSFDAEARARATLTADTCVLDDDRYVRACLEIPVVGGSGPLVYGVWVTLSQKSFEEFCRRAGDLDRYTDGPYFGWFSSALPHWPDTINLKTRVHVRPPPLRAVIELEPTDHPLAVAQREGITVERYRQIALELLHAAAPALAKA